eukprot:5738702-Ditylum_brightwellii.AAC.1
MAAKALHEKVAKEKQRERNGRLQRIKDMENRKSVNSVIIEESRKDDLGNPSIVQVEVIGKDNVEQECMNKVARRSRMSEQSPPMQSPLVEELQYHGMTS